MSGGRGWGGRGGLSGKAEHCGLASLKPRLSALQETLRERLALPQPPHGLRPPVEHADALRDQVSAGLGSSPRCRQGGASGLGSWLLREGLEDAHSPAWLLSAELAQSSQEHLQSAVKYGGRRRLPSPGEMQAFLVLGVRAGRRSRTPCGWQELGPLSTGGLTLHLPWQKGQVVHLVLIHLPGGVDYKTNIRTFTVSAGPQRGAGGGREDMGSLGTHPPPKSHSFPGTPISVHMSRWQQRCWRSYAGRWASRTLRKCRSLPSSSSKGTVSHLAWGGFPCCGLEGGSSHTWGWPGHGRGLAGPWAGLALVSLFRL